MKEGQEVYNYYCYFCHGYQGDGKTVASHYLTPPPRDFTAQKLSEKEMLSAVKEGRTGTAMMAFSERLSDRKIKAVVAYIRNSFMRRKKTNTGYHTAENGWVDHEKYRLAFPFATGEIRVDAADGRLSEGQKIGRQLYLSGCITCHEQKNEETLIFETRPVSMPRAGYSHRQEGERKKNKEDGGVDSQSGATPYAKHDKWPVIDGLSVQEKQGERLFQDNCAFCHAADGTGKNWIGQFLEPHARDLTAKNVRQRVTLEQLRHTISNGLENTTMPAWKSVLSVSQIDAVTAYVKRAFFDGDQYTNKKAKK